LSKTNRIKKEQLLEVFQEDEIDLLEGISPQELEFLAKKIEGYRTIPVSIETFVSDEYFLGKNFVDPKFYPFWLKKLKRLYPHPVLPTKFKECIFTGAIGTGKTTAAVVGILYQIYRLLCMHNPQRQFGLTPDTEIRFALFNLTLELVYDVLWQKFTGMVELSPYFTSICEINSKSGQVLFPGNLGVALASKAKHTIGQAIIGGLLDEANFGKTKSSGNAQVYDTYTNILRRMESRFMQELGRLPGTLFLVSSKQDESDFLEQHIETTRKQKIKSTLIVDASLFQVKKGVFPYCGKTFPIFVGNQTQMPVILADESDKRKYEASRLYDVPIEHLEAFQKDPINAIRDILGVSSISKFKLFTNDALLSRAFMGVSPCRGDYIIVSFDSDDQIMDYVNKNILLTLLARNSMSPRVVSLDLATSNDAYGFAMGTITGLTEIKRTDPTKSLEQGNVQAVEPLVQIELVLGLAKGDNFEIPLFKMRKFILDLVALGFPIKIITADSWQSKDTLQLMKKRGFDCRLQSVDKTKEPYYSFKNGIIESRVELPDHPILKREVKDLRETKLKIDHPDDGCFSGSTKVDLWTGESTTLKDLAENWSEQTPVLVYTIRNGLIEPAVATCPRLTKKDVETVIVKLDNEEEICCTPDHKFLLRDDTYKHAKDLCFGDPLRSLYNNRFVLFVESGPKSDVYDLTVNGTSNFALSAGVFVHNSKDLADAAAACTYVLLEEYKAGTFALYADEIDRMPQEVWDELVGRSSALEGFANRYGVDFDKWESQSGLYDEFDSVDSLY
jgi:hypothetical protein